MCDGKLTKKSVETTTTKLTFFISVVVVLGRYLDSPAPVHAAQTIPNSPKARRTASGVVLAVMAMPQVGCKDPFTACRIL